jgi:hypothetical protein
VTLEVELSLSSGAQDVHAGVVGADAVLHLVALHYLFAFGMSVLARVTGRCVDAEQLSEHSVLAAFVRVQRALLGYPAFLARVT